MGKNKIPGWFIIIAVAAMLPLLAWPTLLDRCADDSPVRPFVWFFPAYIIASGVCALLCFKERRELAWILIVLMVLTEAAIIYAL